MPSRPRWDRDQEYIENRIRWATRSLVGKYGFTDSDSEDLKQDFLLDLLQRLKRFNPQRAQRRTFISRIVTNRLARLIQDQKAQKRDYTKVEFSLDEVITREDGEVSRLQDQEHADFRLGVYGRFVLEVPDHEARIHFSTIMESLPQAEHEVCQRLIRGDRIVEIARDLSLHRSTIHCRMQEIRRRIVAANLGPKTRSDTF